MVKKMGYCFLVGMLMFNVFVPNVLVGAEESALVASDISMQNSLVASVVGAEEDVFVEESREVSAIEETIVEEIVLEEIGLEEVVFEDVGEPLEIGEPFEIFPMENVEKPALMITEIFW
jgi:hypothetical protein